MQRNRGSCAYCGQPATSRDHLPPQNIFTPPLPENLITVPACATCNQGAQRDDEVFRNEFSIMAGSFGESANAAERIKPSLRGIQRNKPALAKMVLEARPVERYSAGGIFLGDGYAVPVTPGAHQRVLTRIVRGLHWHHVGDCLGQDLSVKLVFIDKARPDWQNAVSVFGILNPQHVLIGDGQTFQYLYGRAADDPTFSFWLLIFFKGTAEQIVLAHTPEKQSKTDQRPAR